MKRIRLCGLCPAIYRESLMYTVYYTGWMRQANSDAYPQTWVNNERILVCPQCYSKAGYKARKVNRASVRVADFPIKLKTGDIEYMLRADPQTGDTVVVLSSVAFKKLMSAEEPE